MLQLFSGGVVPVSVLVMVRGLGSDSVLSFLQFRFLIVEAVLPDLLVEHGLVLTRLFLLNESLTIISRKDHENYRLLLYKFIWFITL
jgi:hypothetical protein